MKKAIPFYLSIFLVSLFVTASTAKADSYEGPFCFEKPSAGTEDDSGHLRGTCKELQFVRIISLENVISHYFFIPTEGAATTSGPITIDPGYAVGNAAIRFETVEEIYTGDMIYGHPIYLSDMASDDLFSTMSVASSGVSFVDQYGRPTTEPFSGYYKNRGGIYTSITSPVTKLVEYWHIAPKPNGFELVKDKTELVLDDGSIKAIVNERASALSSAQAASSSAPTETYSWWSGVVQFFRNLF